jgi:uncharacterized cofD-like protein
LGRDASGNRVALAGRLTGIVTVTDDGGSSGRLRRDLGILPPGDVRNCLVALAEQPAPLADLLQYRFEGTHGLHGHPVGNLLLAALTQMTGTLSSAVQQLADLVRANGTLLLATNESVHLRADFADGDTTDGETAIVAQAKQIRRVCLPREVRPLPEALRALVNADVIVVGPGSLYTSILPNLLVAGVASTISAVNAVRIYVANLTTQPGETDDYTLEDHVTAIADHAGAQLFDYVLVSATPIRANEIAGCETGACPVRRASSRQTIHGAHVVERELGWELDRGKIRHAPADLANAILDLARIGRATSLPAMRPVA